MTAESLADAARKTEEGSYHGFLASVLFSYFAFEAFLNFLGYRIATDQWKNERTFFSTDPYRGTFGKLRFLAEKCQVNIDLKQRPWSTLKELSTARYAVTHAHLDRVDQVVRAATAAELPSHVPPVIFRYGERDFAELVLADVEAAGDQILQAAIARGADEIDPHGPKAFRGMMWHQGGWLAAE
jgi:hypothetical protein